MESRDAMNAPMELPTNVSMLGRRLSSWSAFNAPRWANPFIPPPLRISLVFFVERSNLGVAAVGVNNSFNSCRIDDSFILSEDVIKLNVLIFFYKYLLGEHIMDKLSLESLFGCKTHNNREGDVLDVRSITRNQKAFDVGVLLETREKKRVKLLGYYEKAFEICIKKIEVANNLGKTDLMFSVREFVPCCPQYGARGCID
ncbi:MAG: hypothetical protein Hyperionvirus33_1, partial [Hyperionvirus sp.]